MAVNFDKKRKEPKRIHIGQYEMVWYALPIGLAAIPFFELADGFNKIVDKIYDKQVWSDEKAKKLLDKNLCNVLSYDEEDKEYRYYTGMEKLDYKVPWGYKIWAKRFERDLQYYLIYEYEADGYTKEVEQSGICTNWKWVTFRKVD